jgi:D-arabinan endo alpha-(1,5)-arabinofuranosidase
LPAARRTDGKLADITGPGITDRWGVTCADLGASVTAPNGSLVSVFGDTFSGNGVGQGDWRSPVILIGTGDAEHPIIYQRAGGTDPEYAHQLWRYQHRTVASGRPRGGISTVIPSDLLRVDDSLYLHAIVNRGFGNVVWTEIWRSDDSGMSWRNLGTKFPAGLHDGHAQCWSWDYDPADGWIYLVSTGFQRDKGIILRRVRPEDIGDPGRYSCWGHGGGRWSWGREPTPLTPDGETWGELSLRRIEKDRWILGGFVSSKYALGYRVIDSPTAARDAPLQLPVVGCAWDAEDHAANRVAQLYGGYVLPGSQLGVAGGVGLVVSQWHTARGWPYQAMQFRVTLRDTTTPRR